MLYVHSVYVPSSYRSARRKATVHAISQAEQSFTEVDAASEPEWAEFIDPACLGGEWVNAFRDIDQPDHAEEHARASIAHA